MPWTEPFKPKNDRLDPRPRRTPDPTAYKFKARRSAIVQDDGAGQLTIDGRLVGRIFPTDGGWQYLSIVEGNKLSKVTVSYTRALRAFRQRVNTHKAIYLANRKD